jgi:hypothetical protein
MKVQDIIRNMLDLIDQIDGDKSPADQEPNGYTDDDLDRFKQIAGLHTGGDISPLSNSPNEKIADIDAITKDAGSGDVNGPHHPSDIRVQHPSAYPGHQHKVGE